MSKQSRMFDEDEPEIRKNIPLEEAKRFTNKLLIQSNFNNFEVISVVGSIRRKRKTVNDIDFLIITSDEGWRQLRNYLLGKLKAKKVCAGDKIQRYILDGIELDIYRATKDTYGITKLIRTGSAGHNVYLAKLAISKGMRIKYSLGVVKDAKVIAGSSESGIFTVLGLPWIEPELREVIKGKPMWELK